MSHNENFKAPPEHPLVEENRKLAFHLTAAQAFVNLWKAGFDALVTHGINFKLLPEYLDDHLLDEAIKPGIEPTHARSKVMTYVGRVESAIRAAVRRKQFRNVNVINRPTDKKE